MEAVLQLYQQLADSTLDANKQALIRCALARELEESGDYDAARAALGDFWQRVGDRPRLANLHEPAAAELLLRCGTLTGWLGAARQVAGAQETAKDLLSESSARFESLGLADKLHEARIEIAWIYCHEGSFDEARAVLRQTVEQLGPDAVYLKGVALVRCALVEIKLARYESALEIFLGAEALIKSGDSHSLRGRYYNGLALVYKNLAASHEDSADYIDRALVNYTAAAVHFEEAGHIPYSAMVENNLGSLLFKCGRFSEAEAHLNTARKLFSDIRDEKRVAETDDTRARLLLAEGRPAQAERVMRGAIYTLEKGGPQALLAEALITHAVALARVGDTSAARPKFDRAIDISEMLGDYVGAGQAALSLLEELEADLSQQEFRRIYDQAHQYLSSSQHDETRERLRQCKLKIFTVVEKSRWPVAPLPPGYMPPVRSIRDTPAGRKSFSISTMKTVCSRPPHSNTSTARGQALRLLTLTLTVCTLLAASSSLTSTLPTATRCGAPTPTK